MASFEITYMVGHDPESEVVEADSFRDAPPYVDFVVDARDGMGGVNQVLRVRQDEVSKIKRLG